MIKKHLSHHGIKGQRWGVRRYQNPDGSLTALGQKKYNTDKDYDSRYNKASSDALTRDYKERDAAAAKAIITGTGKAATQTSVAIGNSGKNKSKVINTKNYGKISDNDLRARINRINMENTYGELTGDAKRVRTGSDWTREILQTTGAVIGVAGTAAGIALTIAQIRNKQVPKAKGGP